MTRHTITVTNGQNLAVAKQQAEKTGRSWFVLAAPVDPLYQHIKHSFFEKVVDSTGRRGYEQYMALEFTPTGESKVREAAPRA